MPRWSVMLVLLLTTGCVSTRVIRLETGQGRTAGVRAASWNASVEVDRHAFEEALTRLVLAEPFTLPPQPTRGAGARFLLEFPGGPPLAGPGA